MVALPRRGLMYILSSPSGAGKSSISRALLERHDDLSMSVSATTRPPRPGEVDGKDYFFIDMDEHKRMAEAGEFLEFATVFGNAYGTPRKPVDEALDAGRDVLFDIDWQGAQQLRQNADSDVISVFILPPSVKELEKRLFNRAQDSEEVVRGRMARASDEMSHWPEYDYIIVNEDLDRSIAEAESILRAERLKRRRQVGIADFVNGMRTES